ncbi:MAG: adenylate cyclase [Pseudomonadota bacterium]|jgi:adenylate cyclase
MITKLGLRFPFFVKLLTATVFILLIGVIPLIFQNKKMFERVASKREIEANNLSATSKAVEVNSLLQGLFEKMKAIAILAANEESVEANKSVKVILEQDSDLFAVDVYERTTSEFKLNHTFFRKERLDLLGVDAGAIDKARHASELSIDQIARGQIEIRKVLLFKELPLVVVAYPIVKDELGYSRSIGVAYVLLSKFQKILRHKEKREIFLLDHNGDVFSNGNEKVVAGLTDFRRHPMFEVATKNQELSGQLRYADPLSGEMFYGSYAKTNFGLLIFNQVSEARIFAPEVEVFRQNLMIIGLVLSGSVLLIYLLSLGFVSPLEKLTDLIERVGSGDFSVAAGVRVKNKDEIGDLALAFDEMVTGLKARDKEKKLLATLPQTFEQEEDSVLQPVFSKSKKKYTVLVSTIRGLNDINRSLPTDEIVNSLNEYFSILVKVVRRHGGAIDKFINNSFIVTWGSDEDSSDDGAMAIDAALEMRRAIAELNEKRLAREEEPLLVGMGLHQGFVIQSSLESDHQFEFTLAGDTLNLATKIEARTEECGTDLLISASIADLAQEKFWLEYSIDIQGNGRNDHLQLFEVKGIYKEGKRLAVPLSYSYEEAEERRKQAA